MFLRRWAARRRGRRRIVISRLPGQLLLKRGAGMSNNLPHNLKSWNWVKMSPLPRARNKTSRKDQVLTSINRGILAELMTLMPNRPKGRLGRAVEVGMSTSHCAYFCVREKKTIYSFRPSCSMQKQLYKSSFQFYQPQFILVLLLILLSKLLIRI